MFPFHIYCLGLNIWDGYIFYLFPFSLKDIYGSSQNPLSTNGSFWIRLKWCRCIYWGKARQVYRAMYCGIILLDPLCNIISLNLRPPSQLHKNIDIQRKLCVGVDLDSIRYIIALIFNYVLSWLSSGYIIGPNLSLARHPASHSSIWHQLGQRGPLNQQTNLLKTATAYFRLTHYLALQWWCP